MICKRFKVLIINTSENKGLSTVIALLCDQFKLRIESYSILLK